MSELLPPSATQLERRFATVGAAISDIPVPLATLMNPDTIRLDLLPWLAWHLGIDAWENTWPEAQRRDVVRNAIQFARQKGTIAAVRRAIAPIGELIEVIEWWQETPPARRGTFRMRVGVLDSGITETMHVELERLINGAKPVSRHLMALDIVLVSRGPVHVGAISYDGDSVTVYPYLAAEISIAGRIEARAAAHVIDTLTTYP